MAEEEETKQSVGRKEKKKTIMSLLQRDMIDANSKYTLKSKHLKVSVKVNFKLTVLLLVSDALGDGL